jgi:site-specific DNA recombinase
VPRRALQRPQERDEASEAIGALIDPITLTPGHNRGEIAATLHGDLGTIIEWTAQKANTPGRLARECRFQWLRG